MGGWGDYGSATLDHIHCKYLKNLCFAVFCKLVEWSDCVFSKFY